MEIMANMNHVEYGKRFLRKVMQSGKGKVINEEEARSLRWTIAVHITIQ